MEAKIPNPTGPVAAGRPTFLESLPGGRLDERLTEPALVVIGALHEPAARSRWRCRAADAHAGIVDLPPDARRGVRESLRGGAELVSWPLQSKPGPMGRMARAFEKGAKPKKPAGRRKVRKPRLRADHYRQADSLRPARRYSAEARASQWKPGRRIRLHRTVPMRALHPLRPARGAPVGPPKSLG